MDRRRGDEEARESGGDNERRGRRGIVLGNAGSGSLTISKEH